MAEVHDGRVDPRTTEYPYAPAGSGMGSGPAPAQGESPDITEDVIFLEPGDERAQNIVKAMSHQNAGEVVQLLSLDGPLRLSDIAEQLNMSLNAAKYHIDNLMDAGILEISHTKYSIKGKKVKIYRLKNQVFIVAPRMNTVAELRTALMKYCGALGIFVIVFCSAPLQPFISLPVVPLQLAGSVQPGSSIPTTVMTETTIITALVIAAAVTLLTLAGYELYARFRKPGSVG